jgi:hypothetical protein
MSIVTSGGALIRQALTTLQVFAPQDSIDDASMETGLYGLREVLDTWTLYPGTILTVDRHVFNLTVNKGGPDNPYTLGPGGDWDTTPMARPPSLDAANLLLNTAAPYPVEIPLSFQTDNAYEASQIKTFTNPLATTIYFNPTDPLATIVLWPIPSADVNQIVLYYDRLTATFASLSASYTCAPGYAKAFRLCLAQTLIPYFSVPLDRAAWVEREATIALTDVLASNFKMADLAVDPAWTPTPFGNYNIYTDEPQ